MRDATGGRSPAKKMEILRPTHLLSHPPLSGIQIIDADYSTIQHAEGFGVSQNAFSIMGGLVPTWRAYAVLALELAIVVAFALLVFDRQEESGYQA